MKTLLKKEFNFTAIKLTYIFLVAAFMAFLPGYPILLGPFFVCLGIFYTFQIAREGNDVLYTALLPVKKRDVVKARYIFVVTLQLAAFAIIAVITLIRMNFMAEAAPYVANPLMNANTMYLGLVLMVFAAFNTFFVRGFWKDAYSIGMPLLKAGIAIFVVITLGETMQHLPGLADIDTPNGHMGLQLAILVLGALVYTFFTIASCKASMNGFEKMDLHM